MKNIKMLISHHGAGATLQVVEVIGENEVSGNPGMLYIKKLMTGRTDTTTKDFLLDLPKGVEIHGVTCRKDFHAPEGEGYLHSGDDDTPYNVDGVQYCGRCHYVL